MNLNTNLTWTTIVKLEPRLAALAEQIDNNEATLSTIMLAGCLVGLVGKLAYHPRLRSSMAFGLAYDHLVALDKAAKARRQATTADTLLNTTDIASRVCEKVPNWGPGNPRAKPGKNLDTPSSQP